MLNSKNLEIQVLVKEKGFYQDRLDKLEGQKQIIKNAHTGELEKLEKFYK